MTDYDSFSAEEYRDWMELHGASEEDIQAALDDLEGRR